MDYEIQNQLLAEADPEYREFSKRLNPGIKNVIGVRLPILRKIAAEIAMGDFEKVLNSSNDFYYEELMLRGFIIGKAKMPMETRLEYIQCFVPKINNWAICDSFASSLKFTIKNREEVWKFLQPFFMSDQEFPFRFSVVMTNDHFVVEPYAEPFFEIVEREHPTVYYANMAIAWTLSTFFIKLPEVTMRYLERSALDDFTFNKSIQKIIESYRVDDQNKVILRSMKRG